MELGDFSLTDIDLTAEDGAYFVILGPTGSGKTVLLECIAGLHRLRQGEIWAGNQNITSLPPEKRGIGYVPQDYALFPFLNAKQNILFGLGRGRRGDASELVERLSAMLGIGHLFDRDVRTLSGGEKQRVAIARALAVSPRILLLDEPMGNLDVSTAKYLRVELRKLHDNLGITTIHVTHNLIEAREMADRIAIMNNGTIEQAGPSDEVFLSPRTEFVSDFIGTPNVLDVAGCRDLGHGVMEAECAGMPIVLANPGREVSRVMLFPRDIYVSTTKPPGPGLNRFEGTVTEVKAIGAVTKIRVQVGENILRTELLTELCEEMAILPGRRVFLILKLRGIRGL